WSWSVNPHFLGQPRRCWLPARKSFWMCPICCGKYFVSCIDHLVGFSVVHHRRCEQAQCRVMMLCIVPVEELAAEANGVFQATEATGKFRAILQRLELGL